MAGFKRGRDDEDDDWWFSAMVQEGWNEAPNHFPSRDVDGALQITNAISMRASCFLPPPALAKFSSSVAACLRRSKERNRGNFATLDQLLQQEQSLSAVANGWCCMDSIRQLSGTGHWVSEEPSYPPSPELLSMLQTLPFPHQHQPLLHNWQGAPLPSLGDHPDPNVSKFLYRQARRLYFEYRMAFANTTQFDDAVRVLMVAEKPSVAKAIAEHLSSGKARTRTGISKANPVHEFMRNFFGKRARIKVTSVVGHVFGLDFKSQRPCDEALLFDAETVKKVADTAGKCRVVDHLRAEAEQCTYLCLWLDCDREGENIAFEVISITRETFADERNIYRARFSALTAAELNSAYLNLKRPDVKQALAVDARQELDLKVGVAFTRYLTNRFLPAVKLRFGPDTRLISYGPCQSPTLHFCVERHNAIQNFQSHPFWKLQATCAVGPLVLPLEWMHDCIQDQALGQQLLQECLAHSHATVQAVQQRSHSMARPVGLHTVQLLKAASSRLGLSPGTAMKVAEDLYSRGFISYPRTESTKYPATFDVHTVVGQFAGHPLWGKTASRILSQLAAHGLGPPTAGKDAGDHPPITPVRAACQEHFAQSTEWRLYEYVCRHFFASLYPDCTWTEYEYSLLLGSQPFRYRHHLVTERGFTWIMGWRYRALGLTVLEDQSVPAYVWDQLSVGGCVSLQHCALDCGYTEAPKYLTESELIELMDTHGIGTDASIPTHIQNVCERRYVTVVGADGQARDRNVRVPNLLHQQSGTAGIAGPPREREDHARFMQPTPLGLSLIRAFTAVDPDLVRPTLRANMERQVSAIAEGRCDKDATVRSVLADFKRRFQGFRAAEATVRALLVGPKDGVEDVPVHVANSFEGSAGGLDAQHAASWPHAGRGEGPL
eukprot:GGOE01018648.1.p1 GENE.GGOE01018648.1~~GGOE01018648.1.p1  ORF type:complete len:899 (+),score=203.60 GGOE01018648.1:28-2697(+)